MMSGFNLPEAVEHMAQSSLDGKMQSVLFNVSDRLKQGEPFSTIIKSYLTANDMVSISLLETAEHTGDYQEILLDLEEHASWQLEFKSRIQRSLRYPSIVFGALWVSIFCILYFFAPQLYPSSFNIVFNRLKPVCGQLAQPLDSCSIYYYWICEGCLSYDSKPSENTFVYTWH
jgi:type II secretory pathway component PulF